MPQTNAERKRKYIATLKENGKYEDFLKRKAEQEKEKRQRQKHNLSQMTEAKQNQVLSEMRMKCRKRVGKHRKMKKGSVSLKSLSETSSYRTKSALRKATTKTRKTLPLSPSKRNAVLSRLVHSLDLKDQYDIFGKTILIKSNKANGISSDIVSAVQKFYQNDDIGRMSPNVKDCRFIKNQITGQKEVTQIRHLMYKLREVYELFLIDYATNLGNDAGQQPPLKLSKFCSLRPKQVKLINDMPHNVCACIYHENFIECCSVLNKNLPGVPTYSPELSNLLVCEQSSRNCWFKQCQDCMADKIDKKLSNIVKASKKSKKFVTWREWEKDDDENRIQRVSKKGNLKDLMNKFIEIYPQFLKHSFIKRAQSETFRADRASVELAEYIKICLLHIDFAESYPCKGQDQAHSAYWNQFQISLFTVALYYEALLHSKVIASDNNDHSKNTIVAYLYTIFLCIPKTVEVVKIWSDGPTSQFKNRFVAAVIMLFEKMFRFKIIWNYFATAHGKGCVDGIGAVAKNKVRRMVISRKATVNCAKDFVAAYKMESSPVEVFELTDVAINKINNKLKLDDVFAKAPSVPDISSFHQLQVINNKICGFVTSSDGYKK